jgi:hypothetical protein
METAAEARNDSIGSDEFGIQMPSEYVYQNRSRANMRLNLTAQQEAKKKRIN